MRRNVPRGSGYPAVCRREQDGERLVVETGSARTRGDRRMTGAAWVAWLFRPWPVREARSLSPASGRRTQFEPDGLAAAVLVADSLYTPGVTERFHEGESPPRFVIVARAALLR